MMSWRDKHPIGYFNNGDETTEHALLSVIHSTKTVFRPLPGSESRRVDLEDRIMLGVDCDEVYPNILIGDAGAAKNKQYLRKIGVTHVLNTAEGNRFGMVNTSRDYYRDSGIKYMGLQLQDLPVTNIALYFEEAADFIEEAIKSGGKVLVHCLMGMSRSSTCVLAYLMIKERLPAAVAIKMVRTNRDIRPNNGFLRQLADLDNRLKRERQRAAEKYNL
ncbi:dual specificity protein phosphatase 3 [Schistocerca nitens]|uniref:dual specificity protein phosphatase 3 n=1 Tax=Schistocerca cancellata TaxID=274614 RepID=UPI002117AE24|nr:dual specificity protein phosphatase 3 [Schistocerca cancellata]XP_049815831.1 dual specificity protein phosphatase 3 [Schistocerca nitens]